jgi:hypothetical protein
LGLANQSPKSVLELQQLDSFPLKAGRIAQKCSKWGWFGLAAFLNDVVN